MLIALGAIGSAVEVAFRHDSMRAPQTTLWFAVPVAAIVVLPLLARRRWRFAAPVSVWLLGAAASFVDGRLVVFSVGLFAAGMAGSLLLGNVPDDVRGRLGLAIVVGGAAIVVGNDPHHAPGEFIFIPVIFAIAWLAGFALREGAAQAEVAEARALQAEREREESARRAVFEERVRIARELHDVVAHHVSMMGVQAGAARVVFDRDRVKATSCSLLLTAATIPVGTLILAGRGEATLGAGGLADVLWRNLAVAAILGPLGVCVGALVRNQIATVVGLVAVAAVLEPAVFQLAPAVGRFGPLAGAPGGVLGGADATGRLAPGPALAVLTAWTLAAFAAAAWRLRRRDLI